MDKMNRMLGNDEKCWKNEQNAWKMNKKGVTNAQNAGRLNNNA